MIRKNEMLDATAKRITRSSERLSLKPIRWILKRILPIERLWREKVKGFEWFNEVWDGIYLGGAPYRPSDLRWLLENNIRAVLNTTEEWVDDEEFFKREKIFYMNIPIPDHSVHTKEQLIEAADFIKTHHDRSKNVLVHCAKGRGRSSAIVCGYLCRESGLSLALIIHYLKKIRPLVSMSKGQIDSVTDYLESTDQGLTEIPLKTEEGKQL